jgi:hypothetical protein
MVYFGKELGNKEFKAFMDRMVGIINGNGMTSHSQIAML